MKKLLIAVDDTRFSKAVLASYQNLVQKPAEVILLHVERLEGRSLMINMLGDPEINTLKESMKGTEHKARLDARAEKILNYYKKEIMDIGPVTVKTIIRDGHPAEEILRVAREECAELILIGCSGRKGLNRLISGSVAAEVRKHSKVPVLIARNTVMCEEPFSWRDAYTAISVTTAVIIGLFILGVILDNAAHLH